MLGGVAGLHFHPKKVEWLHFESTFSSVIGKQLNGEYLPFVPAHKLSLEIRVEKENLMFLKKLFTSINTYTAFNQNNAAPDETTTAGYTLIDLSIGGKIKLKNQFLSLSINANNILDTKYIDHLSTLKEVNLYNLVNMQRLNLVHDLSLSSNAVTQKY